MIVSNKARHQSKIFDQISTWEVLWRATPSKHNFTMLITHTGVTHKVQTLQSNNFKEARRKLIFNS